MEAQHTMRPDTWTIHSAVMFMKRCMVKALVAEPKGVRWISGGRLYHLMFSILYAQLHTWISLQNIDGIFLGIATSITSIDVLIV